MKVKLFGDLNFHSLIEIRVKNGNTFVTIPEISHKVDKEFYFKYDTPFIATYGKILLSDITIGPIDVKSEHLFSFTTKDHCILSSYIDLGFIYQHGRLLNNYGFGLKIKNSNCQSHFDWKGFNNLEIPFIVNMSFIWPSTTEILESSFPRVDIIKGHVQKKWFDRKSFFVKDFSLFKNFLKQKITLRE